MKCFYCGSELKPEAFFCGNCGKKIEKPIEQPLTQPENGVEEPIQEPIQPIQEPIQPIQEPIQPIQEPIQEVAQEANTALGTQEVPKSEDYVACCKNLLTMLEHLQEKTSGNIDSNNEQNEELEQLRMENEDLKKQLAGFICSNCGNHITPQMKFCNVCGFKLHE